MWYHDVQNEINPFSRNEKFMFLGIIHLVSKKCSYELILNCHIIIKTSGCLVSVLLFATVKTYFCFMNCRIALNAKSSCNVLPECKRKGVGSWLSCLPAFILEQHSNIFFFPSLSRLIHLPALLLFWVVSLFFLSVLQPSKSYGRG